MLRRHADVAIAYPPPAATPYATMARRRRHNAVVALLLLSRQQRHVSRRLFAWRVTDMLALLISLMPVTRHFDCMPPSPCRLPSYTTCYVVAASAMPLLR